MDFTGHLLPLWSGIPFVGMILSIALLPLISPGFWHRHYGKVSLFWGLILAIPYIIVFRGSALHDIAHIVLFDYLPLIILLWALFTVSGGIILRGGFSGKPLTNVWMILTGTIFASIIGTTGAALLMVRPLIKSNRNRKHTAHIFVFLIFLVANIGGSLTPLGDPPLFLGFLNGVSFFWTLNLFPMTAVLSLFLLIIFFALDSYYYKKENMVDTNGNDTKEKFSIRGLHNFYYLIGIIGAVLVSGFVRLGVLNLPGGIHLEISGLLRNFVMICIGLLSLKTTDPEIRKENGFSWHPIKEVAILFAGIFITIVPILGMLGAGINGGLGFIIKAVSEPWQYFWAAGLLGSILDNAPTYLTFFNIVLERFFAGKENGVTLLMSLKPIFLMAISAGSVFMGAMTYIGNAPNFMIKSIVEENGIIMPSFFGYILKYSLVYLIPAFIIISLIFF